MTEYITRNKRLFFYCWRMEYDFWPKLRPWPRLDSKIMMSSRIPGPKIEKVIWDNLTPVSEGNRIYKSKRA